MKPLHRLRRFPPPFQGRLFSTDIFSPFQERLFCGHFLLTFPRKKSGMIQKKQERFLGVLAQYVTITSNKRKNAGSAAVYSGIFSGSQDCTGSMWEKSAQGCSGCAPAAFFLIGTLVDLFHILLGKFAATIPACLCGNEPPHRLPMEHRAVPWSSAAGLPAPPAAACSGGSAAAGLHILPNHRLALSRLRKIPVRYWLYAKGRCSVRLAATP